MPKPPAGGLARYGYLTAAATSSVSFSLSFVRFKRLSDSKQFQMQAKVLT
jgi:hypothetical protein